VVEVHVYVDVSDLERGIDFYARGLGLRLGRRLEPRWVEMTGAPLPLHLLEQPAGSVVGGSARDYGRHWTPVHLDFIVPSLERAVDGVCAAGGRLDREVQERAWEGKPARMANVADPFGNGLCLLEEREGRADGLDVYVDVPDLAHGIDFYTHAFDLRLRRELWPGLWAELEGTPVPIYLLGVPAGTPARVGEAGPTRDYGRHWTPVHLDFLTDDLEPAVRRARAAGAVVEREAETAVWGRMANLADPFGHGLDLIELGPRGYDVIAPLP
jgi:predicted enzyme related to lactoylglutathione lyase